MPPCRLGHQVFDSFLWAPTASATAPYVLDVMHTASEAPGYSQAPPIGRQDHHRTKLAPLSREAFLALKTSWESFLVHQLSRLRYNEAATSQDIY
jgi:hypothetical protein